MSESGYYLGFDLSTQQLKCLAIDDQLNIVTTAAIEFDKDFPHYNTRKGVYIKDEGVIDAPVAMWLEAIDHSWNLRTIHQTQKSNEAHWCWGQM